MENLAADKSAGEIYLESRRHIAACLRGCLHGLWGFCLGRFCVQSFLIAVLIMLLIPLAMMMAVPITTIKGANKNLKALSALELQPAKPAE